ncbi:MAG: proline racemase family protein [Gemmataceae bacterium]
MHPVRVIDSHTAGEPTRVVLDGAPDLGTGPLAERRERFRTLHDRFRSAIVNEPRGSDVLVGALLLPPADPAHAAATVFFNNLSTLGMCGHGTIGLAVTLGHLGRISAGRHLLDTPVGVVAFDYDGANRVALENVPSYRHRHHVAVDVEGRGTLRGDIAWGGNWFFLVNDHGLPLQTHNIDDLLHVSRAVKRALVRDGITGADGAEIDHIELTGPPADPANHGRNFVLCPGGAYDRSPCGTGTSAKLACLYADGKLAPGQVWRQEGILGGVFEGGVTPHPDGVVPRISGSAYVTAEATLLIDPNDPLAWGVRP